MGTILYTPVDVGNGYWKMELDQKKVNEFILKAMRRVIDKGVVYINADPPKRPSDIIQYAPGMGGGADKCYGFDVNLNLETGRLQIAVQWSKYRQARKMTENECYMAIREDIERIISLFSNVDM